MGCAHKQNQDGFTLVEISIVMIIIGLLIGGTFGGMKLIENMQVNRTVQDLKAIESAALTFKDTYGRLPGDIANPSARLPNCTVAPCATGGNGNRSLGAATYNLAITDTDERFTFWHHLSASDLLNVGVKNTTNMEFGEGQPESAIGGGHRLGVHNGIFAAAGSRPLSGTIAFTTSISSALLDATSYTEDCSKILSIDNKIDDGIAYNGLIIGWSCGTAVTATAGYGITNRGNMIYDLKGF